MNTPPEDADLDALFQAAVTGITGLDGSLVRPRWQPVPPKQPEPTVDWCAIGIMSSTPDANPNLHHEALPAPGVDTYTRHETLELLASFYGPNAKKYAGRLRDGLAVPQNLYGLNLQAIGFVSCGPLRAMPYLANEQWVHRIDLTLTFRRKVTRTYAVQNMDVVDVHLVDDTFLDDLIPVPPPNT